MSMPTVSKVNETNFAQAQIDHYVALSTASSYFFDLCGILCRVYVNDSNLGPSTSDINVAEETALANSIREEASAFRIRISETLLILKKCEAEEPGRRALTFPLCGNVLESSRNRDIDSSELKVNGT